MKLQADPTGRGVVVFCCLHLFFKLVYRSTLEDPYYLCYFYNQPTCGENVVMESQHIIDVRMECRWKDYMAV